MKHPTIAIVDNDGNLPVDLARKGLARKDTELTESIQQSIAEEFIASVFSLDGDTAEEVYESLHNQQLMYAIYHWEELMFSPEGFLLLDKGLLEKYNPKRLLVQSAGKEGISKKLADPFFKNSLIATKRESRTTSKTALLQQLTDSGYGGGSFPGFASRYAHGNSQEQFMKSYILMDKASFESVFQLKNVPNYVQEMRASALSFKIDGSDCICADRNGRGQALGPIADFFSRTVTFDEIKERSAVLWADSKEPIPTETLFSKIWLRSFSTTALPYKKKERELVLKSDALIKRYLE